MRQKAQSCTHATTTDHSREVELDRIRCINKVNEEAVNSEVTHLVLRLAGWLDGHGTVVHTHDIDGQTLSVAEVLHKQLQSRGEGGREEGGGVRLSGVAVPCNCVFVHVPVQGCKSHLLVCLVLTHKCHAIPTRDAALHNRSHVRVLHINRCNEWKKHRPSEPVAATTQIATRLQTTR